MHKNFSNLIFCAFFLATQCVHAAGEQSSQPFAQVWKIRGEVTATGKDGGNRRTLKEGDVVTMSVRHRLPRPC